MKMTLPCRAQQRKARMSFSLANGICNQFMKFGSTSVLQPPLKQAIVSGQPPSFGGDVTWRVCNASKNCQPFSFGSSPASAIDPKLLNILKEQQTANILITLKDSTVAALNGIKARNLQSRAEKLNEAAKALKQFTANSQKATLELLSQHERTKFLKIRPFWITNKITVKGADLPLVQQLAKLPEISKIEKELFIKISPPVNLTIKDYREGNRDDGWNIRVIRAPEVWAQGNKGEGITVGTIDSGVRGTHEALRDGFVGEYGWFDAVKGQLIPYDDGGHGTHVMGSLVGRTKDIGVAPGAVWASCKGCFDGQCDDTHMITCGQFMACPTQADGLNPKCEKAPQVVNHSWGGDGGNLWYNDIIEYYHVVGIIPVFAIGNYGPDCGTAISPGDYDNVIGVGILAQQNIVSIGSSAGPPKTAAKIKPDMVAPGIWIHSSVNGGDSAYINYFGSSMASPHVAGTVALLLSKFPNLTYLQVKEALIGGCVPTAPANFTICGNISEETFPNYRAGYGRIDVLNSIGVAESIK